MNANPGAAARIASAGMARGDDGTVAVRARRSGGNPIIDSAPASGLPEYSNDPGVPEIGIGAAGFHGTGAMPPRDHPHGYPDMRERPHVPRPCCATIFICDAGPRRDEAQPAGSLYEAGGDAAAKTADGEGS